MRGLLAILLTASAAIAHGQGVMHGNGAPASLSPQPNCGASRFYVDDSTQILYMSATGSPCVWAVAGSGDASMPSGMIAFIKGGICPTGWTEDDTLAGYNVLVTTSGAGDAGEHVAQSLTAAAQTFAGSSTTVPAETVNSLTAAAQAFTGSSATTNAVSAGTPAGTVGNGTVAWPTGVSSVPVFSGGAGTVPAETFTGSAGTVPAEVFTGTSNQTTSAVSGGTPAGSNTLGAYAPGSIAWPAGVPTNASGAFSNGAISWPAGVPTFAGSAGTVPAETFSGNSVTSSAVSAGTPAGTNTGAAFSVTTVAETTGSGNFVAKAMGGTTLASGTTSITLSTQPTFAGSALATHTHTTTATGTNGTVSFTPAGTNAWPAGVPTIAAGAFTQPTVSWPAGVPTIGAGTFTQPTFAGSVLATHTHTLTSAGTNGTASFTPAGTNGTANFTPAGTVAWPTPVPTVTAGPFSGRALDGHQHTLTATGTNASSTVTGTLNSTSITPLGTNSSSSVSGNIAYFKVIACVKN